MNHVFGAFCMAILIVVFAGPFMVGLFRERKRAQAMKEAAVELGLTYSPRDDGRLFARLSHFYLFAQGGDAGQIVSLMHGEAGGIEATILEYQYSVGSNEGRQTYCQTVICFDSPELALVRFSVSPKKFFHGIVALFGKGGITLDEHPTFSRNYALFGDDENAVRTLFQGRVVEYFEDHPGISVEGEGSLVLFYRASTRVKPQDLRFFLTEGFNVLGLFR
jgi:hypothetical protein